MASNVVGLELAFEHRNHFALIGMVLAIGSLLAHASQRLRIRHAMQAKVCPLLLAVLCGATLLRAHDWHSKLYICRVATEGAPATGSARTQLCASRCHSGCRAFHGKQT